MSYGKITLAFLGEGRGWERALGSHFRIWIDLRGQRAWHPYRLHCAAPLAYLRRQAEAETRGFITGWNGSLSRIFLSFFSEKKMFCFFFLSSKGAKNTFWSATNNCIYLGISVNMRSGAFIIWTVLFCRYLSDFHAIGKALKTHAFTLTSFGPKISFLW